jgi:molecular chaperone IbpA
MRNMLDFSPYRRSLIGFDHLFNLLENATTFDVDGYPPYDVEQEGEDAYRIRLAVAGYASADVDVTTHQNVLIITGRKPDKAEDRKFLYRGIPAGGFERRFQLADHVQVTGANLKDGVLEIDLKREVPEAAKPKKIAIGESAAPKRIGRSQAAEAA